ncbi:hypothetical protein VE01_08085 [Pseudogymnoascus verrucosus]|uniref:PNPLA domain-containing protein n=1 Tax=Pseudogymnoascus verrucosus TaxID=342668 RepID=A0A1B8GCR6_9PEZI|nr:uncharacterized protein VE01_08085 [Pseudogymnoascus verrucosus]OBT93612.2 hypothetical protein VE01_08085 [Pseudogymnoascus verrucosus]
MQQVMSTKHAREPNPVDTTGLCLLSLDGGGVRGLSTLYILKSIMDRLNHERKKTANLPPVKPCELFDLIGGTSTGGLIAIMLGRLEMDVDECITAYSNLAAAIFSEKISQVPVNIKGKIKPRFDSAKLESAIRKAVAQSGVSETDLFNDGTERGCRTFVCTADRDTKDIVRLRSYSLIDEPNIHATICQAALATSAATTFFDPVSIGDRAFADGGLGANNPVDEVEGEASNIWCSETGDLKPLVKCFISIGTGNPGKTAFEDGIFKFLGQTVVDIATETENTEKKFIARWAKHFDESRYFRFNVDQGLQTIGLDEYKKKGAIESATGGYLTHTAQKFQVRDCIQNMKLKQIKTDPSFAALISKYTIRQHSGSGATIFGNVHWIVPRPVNDLFTGRIELLDRMKKALSTINTPPTDKRKIFVITGLGGQGKSEICLQVANLMRKEFWGIFWVNVDMLSTATDGFITIAETLGSAVKDVPSALRALAKAERNWLLILDNADTPDFDYQVYLPSGTHGAIIITSRNSECSQYNTVGAEVIKALKDQDSQELLFKAANLPQDSWSLYASQATEILHLLGSHTLALIQAGAYIARGHCKLHEYPNEYRRQRKRLLEFRPKQARSTYGDVYATFEASAYVLKQSKSEAASDALQLLGILSMLDSSILPLQLFQNTWEGCRKVLHTNRIEECGIDVTTSHVLQLPAFVMADDDEWDSYRLTKARDLLASLSLVTQHNLDGSPGLSMHPLIHAWAKDRQDLEKQGITWISTGCVLALSRFNTQWRTQERRLLPHVQTFVDIRNNREVSLGSEPIVVPILLECGWILLDMRQDSKLDGLLKDIFVQLGKKPDELSKEFLPLYNIQARSLVNLGHYKKAVKLLEQMVEVEEATLAKDDPDRLASQHVLAEAYQANGQVKEAVKLLQQVVKIRKATLAENHLDRLASQRALAIAYQANGQVKEAVKLLQQVVDIGEATLAKDDPDRLASQHTLAIAYQANGQVKEAIKLLKQVVKIEEATLAEDHPDRLASQHALAGAYQANGQVKEAAKLLQQVVEIGEATLAKDHPNQLASQQALAVAYQSNGQVKEAVKLLQQVVEIGEATLAKDHPNQLDSQQALAIAYQSNGQVKEAVKLLQQVVKIRKATLAKDHPSRLKSQHALAIASRQRTGERGSRARARGRDQRGYSS